MNLEKRKSFIKKIENRFSLLLTISMFFPVVVYYRHNLVQDFNPDQQFLNWSLPFILSLAAYVFYQAMGDRIEIKYLEWIKGLLLWGIGSYIMPSTFYMAWKLDYIDWYTLTVTFGSIIGVVLFPVIILVLLGIQFCKATYSFLKNFKIKL